MGIFRIGKCDYCGEENKILRPSPYMADIAYMCEEDWDMTQEEYKNSTGEYIVDFKSDIKAYEEMVKNKKQEIQGKNIQKLIEYLKTIKKHSGEDTEVRVDGM